MVQTLEPRIVLSDDPGFGSADYTMYQATNGVASGSVDGNLVGFEGQATIEIDLDGDGTGDGSATEYYNGSAHTFSVGVTLPLGTHMLAVRATGYDAETEGDVTTPWTTVTATVTAPPNDPPSVEGLGFEPGSASGGSMSGSVTGQLNDDGANYGYEYTLQVDTDGDSTVDSSGTIYATSSGAGNTAAFNVGLNPLTFGQHTLKVRATEVDSATGNLLEGDWEDLPVTITAPPNDPPTVSDLEFTQLTVTNGAGTGDLTGTLTDDGANNGGAYIVEIDLDGDESADASYQVAGPNGSFTTWLGSLPIGDTEVAVRATEVDQATGDLLEGDWQTVTATIINTPPVFDPPEEEAGGNGGQSPGTGGAQSQGTGGQNTPALPPSFRFEVAENFTGTLTEKIVARDNDPGDRVDRIYSITGDTSGIIAINEQTGELTINYGFDYEQLTQFGNPAEFTFTVEAKDTNGATSEADVTIVVTDVEGPLVVENLAVTPGRLALGQGSVTLTGTVRMVVEDPNEVLKLNVDWGDGRSSMVLLTTEDSRDFSLTHTYAEDEEQSQYVITAVASAIVSVSPPATVTVMNNRAPVLSRDRTPTGDLIPVKELTATPEVTGWDFYASDADGDNLTFSVADKSGSSGPAAASWLSFGAATRDAKTGISKAKLTFDRASCPPRGEYTILVKVSDGSRVDQQEVKITVKRVLVAFKGDGVGQEPGWAPWPWGRPRAPITLEFKRFGMTAADLAGPLIVHVTRTQVIDPATNLPLPTFNRDDFETVNTGSAAYRFLNNYLVSFAAGDPTVSIRLDPKYDTATEGLEMVELKILPSDTGAYDTVRKVRPLEGPPSEPLYLSEGTLSIVDLKNRYQLFVQGASDPEAIDPNDVRQGSRDDCLFMAPLATVARTSPGDITARFPGAGSWNPEAGSTDVTLYVDKDNQGNLVTRTYSIPWADLTGEIGGAEFDAEVDVDAQGNLEIWAPLLERAIYKALEGTGGNPPTPRVYFMLTGRTMTTVPRQPTLADIVTYVDNTLAAEKPLMMSTILSCQGAPQDLGGIYTSWVSNHAYTVTGVGTEVLPSTLRTVTYIKVIDPRDSRIEKKLALSVDANDYSGNIAEFFEQ